MYSLEHVAEHRASMLSPLYESTWPTDHGDVGRTKFTLNAGLQKDYAHDDLSFIAQPSLPYSQWLYTHGVDSDILYVVSGTRTTQTISRVNSVTLEVLQQYSLPEAIYLGGLLMHKNGHVYCIQSNILYQFWNGDLTNVTSLRVPTNLNGHLVQTNGMTITSDGYIVVKQWNFNLEDALYMKLSTDYLVAKITTAFFVIFSTIVVYLSPFSRRRVKFSYSGFLLELLLASMLTITVVVFVVANGIRASTGGPFSTWEFITNDIVFRNGGGGGELQVIDPISLQVVSSIQLCERSSYPRMSVAPIVNHKGEAEDVIVYLGDENIYQIRWSITSKTLYPVSGWTKKYRTRWSGSFPGTGPAIYDNVVFFTDNTFPIFLFGHTFKLFRLPLDQGAVVDPQAEASSLVTRFGGGAVPAPLLSGVHLTEEGPGFLFYSTVVSPVEGDVIVWDVAHKSVQARRMDDLSLHWETKLWNVDCLMVAADKGHVYVTDYSDASATANDYLREISRSPQVAKLTNLTKFFIVLDASNGKVLSNITVSSGEQMWPSMIIAGSHGDVFFGTPSGLFRVH